MIQNLFDLTGKVALITGGNGGIGLGMAEGLASQGCEVAIWGTNAAKNEQALAVLRQYGPKVSAEVCDVSDPTAVADCFAASLKIHGRVDGCFANAGVGGRATAFDEMTQAAPPPPNGRPTNKIVLEVVMLHLLASLISSDPTRVLIHFSTERIWGKSCTRTSYIESHVGDNGGIR